MEDTEIIRMLTARDEAGLAAAREKVTPLCRHIAKNITRNAEDAEEIAADVLLRIWNTIPPENPPSLKNYAAMITRRLAINRYRAAHARKRGEVLPLEELGDSLGMADDTADRITAAELAQAIGEYLAELNADDRALFVRRYIRCEEITAAAAEMGISAGNARIRLWRMRQNLRRDLERGHFL